MNFVIYSYNFFPQADAESFCATRFASALARAGHNVTVVTMDWPKQVSDKTYTSLIADNLNIVRLSFSSRKNSPLKGLLWYGHKSQMAVDVPESVKAVKKVLSSIDKPILITRTHPVMSTMVGLKTYKHAFKWIAHFSDPIPWLGSYSDTLGHKLLKFQEMNILRNAFKKADLISVTCNHVCKYFKDLYGQSFDNSKVIVTTHIGDYRLDAPPVKCKNQDVDNILLHPGSIYAQRGGAAIVSVMRELANENIDCKFVQVGELDIPNGKLVQNTDNIIVYDTISAEKSIELRKKARAIFIPDFESPLSYSPYLLSKFVYQIMSNKPIVLYAKKDSEMHDYAVQYPESGIFFAESGNHISLKKAIIDAMKYDIALVNRDRIRECFSEKTIVNNFIESVECVIK